MWKQSKLLIFFLVALIPETRGIGDNRISWSYPEWKGKDFHKAYIFWPYRQACTDGQSFPEFVSHTDQFRRINVFKRLGNPFQNFQKKPFPFFSIMEPTEKKFIKLTHQSSDSSVHNLTSVLFVPFVFLIIYVLMGLIGFLFLPLVLGRSIFLLCYGAFLLVRCNIVRQFGRDMIVGHEVYVRQREVYYAGPLKYRRLYERQFMLSSFWRNPATKDRPKEEEIPDALNEDLGAPTIDLQPKTSAELDIAKEEALVKRDEARKRAADEEYKMGKIDQHFADFQLDFIDTLEADKTENQTAFNQGIAYDPDRASLRHVKQHKAEQRERRRDKREAEKKKELRKVREAAEKGVRLARRGSHESDYSSSSSTPETTEPKAGLRVAPESKGRRKPKMLDKTKSRKGPLGLKELESIFDESVDRHKVPKKRFKEPSAQPSASIVDDTKGQGSVGPERKISTATTAKSSESKKGQKSSIKVAGNASASAVPGFDVPETEPEKDKEKKKRCMIA